MSWVPLLGRLGLGVRWFVWRAECRNDLKVTPGSSDSSENAAGRQLWIALVGLQLRILKRQTNVDSLTDWRLKGTGKWIVCFVHFFNRVNLIWWGPQRYFITGAES
ncbi:hypothetical protein WG66_003179 [Moniliophthora roreri]|nr:hypothetical protein WG66_003179 [Moniliophthora roreri]